MRPCPVGWSPTGHGPSLVIRGTWTQAGSCRAFRWLLQVRGAPRDVARVVRAVRARRTASPRQDDVDQALVVESRVLPVTHARPGAGVGRARQPLLERKPPAPLTLPRGRGW